MQELPALVPCNGCTACCKRQIVVLMDNETDYECDEWPTPYGLVRTLKHKDNGDCVYLGEGGCTIHHRAPSICKQFDCRRWFLSLGRKERRIMQKKGEQDAVLAAGRARLHTL